MYLDSVLSDHGILLIGGSHRSSIYHRSHCILFHIIHSHFSLPSHTTRAKIEEMGRRVWVVVGDLSTDGGVDAVADELLRLNDHWHILVNNHGVNTTTPMTDAAAHVSE